MVALGLLLLLLSGALTAAILVQNTDAAHVSVFGQATSGLTLGGLFVAGLITGAAALLGLSLMLAGAKRRRTRRRTTRQEVRNVRDERESLAEENARLQRELESRGKADVYPTDTATAQHGPSTKG